jgi:hypothetical protein
VITSLELLIELCIVPVQPELWKIWKMMIGYYEASLKILFEEGGSEEDGSL